MPKIVVGQFLIKMSMNMACIFLKHRMLLIKVLITCDVLKTGNFVVSLSYYFLPDVNVQQSCDSITEIQLGFVKAA